MADYSSIRILAMMPKSLYLRQLGPSWKEVKDYRVWETVDCTLFVSREVSFNEASSMKEGEKAQSYGTKKG